MVVAFWFLYKEKIYALSVILLFTPELEWDAILEMNLLEMNITEYLWITFVVIY